MIYKDRREAATMLIPLLEKYRNEEGVVLAVPRGGVPIGYFIAKALQLPLDIIFTKKIGHPESSELAVGAVSLEGRVIDHHYNLPQEYFDAETLRLRNILLERYKLYMGKKKPVEIKNKTIIIVDDGVATGNTLIATIQMIRNKHPGKIIIAVPVAPPQTVAKISGMVDEFICPYQPDNFHGVGQFYDDFSEVSDEMAIQLLREANDSGAVMQNHR